GFIGWDAVRELENLPSPPAADYAIPGQALSFVSDLVVVDHHDGLVLLLTSVLTDQANERVDSLWAAAQSRLDELQGALAAPAEAFLSMVELDSRPEASANVTREEYLDMVATGRRYIARGDVFQVVLSQRFDHPATAHPLDVYRVLRTLNPSPYMYLLALETPDGEPYWVVGSSPEALVKVADGRVFSHPIAGSRPRGDTPEHDAELAE